jgi:site-specific recombinase XerD
METVTMRKTLPEVLNAAEQARLVNLLHENSPTKLRKLCLLRVMLDCGLRAAEVLALRRQDIDWRTGKMKVHGKGKKQRISWLNDDNLDLLKKWMEARRQLRYQNDFVFVRMDGQPMTDRNLRRIFQWQAKKVGLVDKHVHPHTCRHSFATDLLKMTKNLHLVQKAMGHESISTTEIYLHIQDAEMEAALKGLRNGEE